MATIGQQLTSARKELGLSVDDVAHETRIHANVIRSIEGDDFSMFASTTYARSFLKKYSDYLEIDVSEEIQALDNGTEVSLKNSELMDQVRDTLQNNRHMRREQPRRYRRKIEKPGGAPLFLGFILIVLFVSIGVFYFLGYKAESPEELKSEITKNLNKAGDLLKSEELKADSPALKPSPDIPVNPLAPKSTPSEQTAQLAPGTASPDQSPPANETASAADVIAKPRIDLKLEESPLGNAGRTADTPAPAIGPPRPRQTAALDLARPIDTNETDVDLPALTRPSSVPAENSSNGTITNTVENPQPAPAPAPEDSSEDAPAIRAVPIVRNQDGE